MSVFNLILKILTIAYMGFAGVRFVGNGGGFGEMKSYMAFRNMHQSISVCMNVIQLCQLSKEEQLLLFKVLKSLPEEVRLGGIGFFDDPAKTKLFQTDKYVGSVVQLNSSALTQSDGIALSYESISSLILQALISHHQSQLSSVQIKNLAQKVFQNIHESTATSSLTTEGVLVVQIHSVDILSAENQVVYSSIFVETPKNTHDLIENTQLAKICPNNTIKLQLQGHRRGAKLGDLLVQTAWSCDGMSWGQATLIFHLVSDLNDDIVLPISYKILGITRP